jgi:Arc/MetJ-type ribon-helix-helix transcriptional regulator
MSYQFPEDVQKIIQAQMGTGGYRSEDEVLRDALHALVEQQEAQLEEDTVVTDGIRRGLTDVKSGQSQPLGKFDAEFRNRHDIPNDG